MNELTVLEHNSIRVMTTEQLAEAYGCSPKQIQQNFSNNRVRFIAGKHFFVLEGQDLQTSSACGSKISNCKFPRKHVICIFGRNKARRATARCWEPSEHGMFSMSWKKATSTL